jgi:DUF4097 and DUF4098 domain-containing protein YvlB
MVQKVKFGLFLILFMFSWLSAENYEQKINRSFTLTPEGSVELANVNGKVDVRTTTAGTVDVTAVKRSDEKGEIEAVDVIFDYQGNTLRVSTKYNKKNTRAKVDFTVVIPEKLRRAAFKSVNGAIDCQGKFADLNLKSVNGSIRLGGDFVLAALQAVNGEITVSQEARLQGDLGVETVNGAVRVELNGKSAFSVEGSTVNGSIDCDFPVTVERHLVGRSLAGQVNGGGHKLTVETVNGKIEISKI